MRTYMYIHPAQVDAVVKRAWQEVYNGMKGCIDEAVDTFLEKYKDYVLKLPSFDMENGSEYGVRVLPKNKGVSGSP